MFISNNELIEMIFYYKKSNKFRYVIYNKKEFEENNFEEEEKKKYHKLALECIVLTFGLSNSLHMESMVEGFGGFKEINLKHYNENKLLKIIKSWNAKDENGKSVSLNIENIRNLAPEIAAKILKDYDDLYYNEEMEKN